MYEMDSEDFRTVTSREGFPECFINDPSFWYAISSKYSAL